MIKSILVPVDGSENSDRAVMFATNLAAAFEASVLLVHVLSTLPARKQLKDYLNTLEAQANPDEGEIGSVRGALLNSGEDEGKKVLANAERVARNKGVEHVSTVIEDGDPAEEILRLMDTDKYDLIVMGRRGIGGLKGLLIGSVSNKISNLANCTVVTVK
jgi:nucleotide-binding universal stress UspA family protein